MTEYGVTSTGFVKKTLDVLLSELQADERDKISAQLNLLATAVLGQLNGIFADKARELWDVAETIYRSAFPNSASDDALEQIASITRCLRLAAKQSVIILDRLYLDAHQTIPAGSRASVGATGEQFETLIDTVNTLDYPATVSVAAVSVNYGLIQGLAGTIDTIQTPVSGWSASPALTCANTQPYIFSGGETLIISVDGDAIQTVAFTSGSKTADDVASIISGVLSGGTAEAVGTFVRIKTSNEDSGASIQVTGGLANTILGFNTALIKGFNSLDATLGRNQEVDSELRTRRVALLRVTGSAALDALRAHLLELDGVIQVLMLENTTMTTDGDGLPPKSYEAIIYGGTDADIAQSIFDIGPEGIESFGTTVVVVYDSQSIPHNIGFSRPTPLPMYISAVLVIDPLTFPSDGIVQAKVALNTYGDALQVGDDVIALAFKATPLTVPGVIDVTTFKIDTANPPTNTANITVSPTSLATFDTSRMTVTTV